MDEVLAILNEATFKVSCSSDSPGLRVPQLLELDYEGSN